MPSLYDRTFGPTEEEEPRRGPTVERAQAMRPSFRMSSAGRRAPGTGTSSMDRIVGLGEAAASMGTEMLSQVPAGVATMMALPFGAEGAAKAGQQVSEALTYLPRSEAGIGALEALEKPMAAMGAPGSAAGEEVMRRTGSPLLATATEMVVQPLNLLAAPAVARGAARGARAAGRAAKAAGRELGPKAAEMAESYMRRSGMMPEITVYHGSPHIFPAEEGLPLGRFRAEKIGTGEGAQAYGVGTYTAESPDVAKTYQPRDTRMEEPLMKKYSDAEKSLQFPAMQVYEDFLLHKTPQEVLANIKESGYSERELQQAMRAHKFAADQYAKQTAGALYTVDLPDPIVENMLDWDKPLSEQPPNVQKVLQKIGEKSRGKAYDWRENLAMGDAYRQIADDFSDRYVIAEKRAMQRGKLGGAPSVNEYVADPRMGFYDSIASAKAGAMRRLDPSLGSATDEFAARHFDQQQRNGGYFRVQKIGRKNGELYASEILRDAGIPGIKYLDEGSRGSGHGTRNFVVFPGEEHRLTILQRNEEKLPTKKAQGGAVEGNMSYTQAADTIAQRLMDQGMDRDQAFNMALRMADAHMKAGGAVMMARGGSPKRAPGVKSTSERAREQQAKRAEERAKRKQEEAERMLTMPPVDRAAYGATQALEKAGVRVMPDAMRRMIEENTAAIAQKDPKLSLEEAAARAQRQAVQQLRWERIGRPAAQEQFGKLSPSAYNMPAQRRLRNLPEAVQERTEKAQAFLAKPTEPWKPPPGELQAFDRLLIKDALEGFPGVEQTRFPRYEPKRANLDYVSEIYDDPVNRELIKKQIARGLPLGGETFYASLYPVKVAAMERGISPEKFDQFVYETAPASARNSILNEMAVGQFLRDMKARGLPLDEETVKAEMAQFKQKYGTGLPLMPVHREGVRQVIEEGRNLREMSKADIPTNYKIPTYGTQKAGDFGKSMVLDVHEAAGQTQASRFHPYFTQQGGFSPKEYGLAEGKMLDIAQEMGIPGGMAQAGRWFGGGELTGLKSPRGDALDLLERQTAYTLQGQGINPTPKAVRDYVLNMIETGEGVLMPYFKNAPIPDVRTRKAEGGEVTLRKGGRAVKGQSSAERARMAQQARQAAQAARARTATAVAPHELNALRASRNNGL